MHKVGKMQFPAMRFQHPTMQVLTPIPPTFAG